MNEKLGATGRHPDGQISKDDEGELRFAIGPHVSGGVAIHFGKPVAWLVLPKDRAINMAMILLKHAGVEMTPADHLAEEGETTG